MNRSPARGRILHFGPFEADRSACELRKRGLRIKLRRQSFDILAALLERPGDVVTREELRKRLWLEPVFVDFEDNLNTAVKHLRSALGESVEKPRYIETVPRLGYRFAGSVTEEGAGSGRDFRLLVLPFSNLSGDGAEEYLSDGLTEEVIGQLAVLDRRLAVIARTSAMHYKGSRKGIATIARELNLDYVLEGSVRRSDERVRVAAQLIDARHETHLWSSNFEGELTDFLRFQCEIAQAVAGEIRLTLVPPVATTVVPAAYDIYLRGTSLHGKYTPPAMMAAAECFEAAVAVDPAFAKAWARLGRVWAEMGFWTYAPGREAYPKAERAARHGLELDDTLADGHVALGIVHWFYHWDLASCEREYVRALELDPGSVPARWGWFVFLAGMKSDFARATREAELAEQLDPLSAAMRSHLGWVYYWGRQYDRAIDQCGRVLKIDQGCLPAYYVLGLAQLAAGRFDESVAVFETSAALHGDIFSVAHLASACGLAGQRQRAEALLAELEKRSTSQSVAPTFFATAQLGLGNNERAFDWLEKAFAEHDAHILWLRVGPHWDPLRCEPRFADLVKRLPLPPEA